MTTILIATFYAVSLAAYNKKTISVTVKGVMNHGTNALNSEHMFDLSVHSALFALFPPLTSIATLPSDYIIGTTQSKYPTADTDRDELLATIPEHRPLPGPLPAIPEEYFSIPVTQVGTLDSVSTTVADRLPITSYEDAQNIGSGNRRSRYAIDTPTLHDFEQITGQLDIKCYHKSHTAKLRFNIQNGIPMSVYTIWELNLFKPFAGPANGEGGDGMAPVLPNIFVTDKRGKGKISFDLPYCPFNSCKTVDECGGDGCPDCVLAYLVAVHWDYMGYGGTSALENTDPALPGGIITSTQMTFYVSTQIEGVEIIDHNMMHRNKKKKKKKYI
eukprot:268009_1